MRRKRISRATARTFYDCHFGDGLPPHVDWWFVSGLTHWPGGWDYRFLIADGDGLTGILGNIDLLERFSE